jgi:prepilin-type N-terminal cleavage/methylation domain-containing protein
LFATIICERQLGWRFSSGFQVFGVKMKFAIGYETGFTLLEIIATMVILSILAALAIPRYISLDESAKQRGVDAGIAEFNGRETLTWSNIKISESGWIDDERTFSLIDTYLGSDYQWAVDDPDQNGGVLTFKDSAAVTLTRTVSENTRPGNWSR